MDHARALSEFCSVLASKFRAVRYPEKVSSPKAVPISSRLTNDEEVQRFIVAGEGGGGEGKHNGVTAPSAGRALTSFALMGAAALMSQAAMAYLAGKSRTDGRDRATTAAHTSGNCPFVPDESARAAHTDESIARLMGPFDPGLLRALVGSTTTATGVIPPGSSVLDLTAGIGQLYTALDRVGYDVGYLGLDSYRNVMELAGRTVRLGDGSEEVVPALCWADPARPFEIGGPAAGMFGAAAAAGKFDFVIALLLPPPQAQAQAQTQTQTQTQEKGRLRGAYRMNPLGRHSFLDNLVRVAGKAVILAWSPDDQEEEVPSNPASDERRQRTDPPFDVRREMARRGTGVDEDATKALADASISPFLKKHLTVFRIFDGLSRPMVP